MTDDTTSTDPLDGSGREVRAGQGGTRVVLLRRRYDAAIDDVWDAITDPDRLKRWFLPVSGDLRVGGRFQLEGNAGGEILRCQPPLLLAITWVYGDAPGSEVELRLAPAGDPDEAESVPAGDPGGATDLVLQHTVPSGPVELDGRRLDPVLNDAVTGIWGLGTGWEMGLVGLDAYLRGEMPGGVAAEAIDEDAPDVQALADRMGAAWAAVVAASGTSPVGDPPDGGG
jgi:uncharacterized protein YndB with AHSA1/START domain